MLSIGIDIGGANTKALLLKDGSVEKDWLEYIPLWERKEDLESFLDKLAGVKQVQATGITMTGELSDIFKSKREGVKEIIKIASEKFGNKACYFMSSNGELLSKDKALDSPEEISAANWIASGLVVGEEYPNCILMDVGSTTTDLIPIQNGTPTSLGRSDFQRLETGELVYTGVLRTPVTYLCPEVEVNGMKVGIASEYFANIGDAYRVLNTLDEEQYNCDTPDGRGKTRDDCMRRMARVFCSDVEELGEEFIEKAAKYFQERQVSLLQKALEKIVDSNKSLRINNIIVTGIGRRILAEEAARSANFKQIIDLADIYGEEAALMTPAFAMSLLAGKTVHNKDQ
ncbi:hypothetical protein AKJ35_00900 [candidate division MSBL1 archaeon SCGC-AAA833F18]|uniref:Hydantoinase A/oxoprolinase domain-containing protein n=2 Tax=candidate division MSBL1 TaxID=215777 RepID=A0A133VSF7_9EURY|nr:hypothetical protein AKJ47_00920 [candidate division MSBL1 archaeon SCGC-AAA261G05]KXB09384.1 hypothetical protein AKJ35_00900 [candidate division MSBL1 archaeon SCGC-AAA833F18]